MRATHRLRVATHAVWWVGGLYGCHSFTSMAYEVVWISLMAASVGRTLAAMGTVLLVCTAGLGLGAAAVAWWARRYALSTRQLFVGIQMALGFGGAAFPWLLHGADGLYTALAPPAESMLHHGLRLAVSAALLLPLACLIGAVFPLLSASAERPQPRDAGRGLGRLYWRGLFWSGLGALATPLGVLPLLGFTCTSLLLGLLNGLAALGGLWLSDLPLPRAADRPARTVPHQRTAHASICGLSTILGFSLFTVESIGAQYLWLIVDATVYAEGLLLGTVLLGMSAGAAAYPGLRRARWSPEGLLMGGLLLLVLSLALWLLLAAEIAAAFEALLHGTVRQHVSAMAFFAVHGLLVLVVLGGPAGATGLGFPTLCELAIRRHGIVTNAVGGVTAWHYVGAGVGAAGTPFLLLPLIGMTWSLVLLSAVLLLTAAWWATSTPWKRGRRWCWGGLGVALAALCWLGGTRDVTFRTRAAGVHNRVILHHEDGTGIVEVYEDQQTGHRMLLSSRLRQEGGDRLEDLHVQRLQGALPVLLHPAPRRVLVVGLGTGISLAASLRPEVEQVTCVELSRGVK